MKVQLQPLFADRKSPVTVSEVKASVGRADDCDVRLYGRGVSRHHCELILDGDSVFVRDLQSTNGTLVNGNRTHDEHPLKEGDILTIANLVYRVAIVPETQCPGLGARPLEILRDCIGDTESATDQDCHPEFDDDRDFDSENPNDAVHEAGLESFPASDPPAWTSSRV